MSKQTNKDQLADTLASLARAQSALYTSDNPERLDDIVRLQKLYESLSTGTVRVF